MKPDYDEYHGVFAQLLTVVDTIPCTKNVVPVQGVYVEDLTLADFLALEEVMGVKIIDIDAVKDYLDKVQTYWPLCGNKS